MASKCTPGSDPRGQALLSRTYESWMVAIMGLALGVNAFEQFSLSYLMPFIQPALRLDNADVGLVTSFYWVAFAAGSSLIGTVADYGTVDKKTLAAIVLAAMALSSPLSGFAGSFAMLAGARALMGLWEGALLTAVQSIVAVQSSDARRGMNMGIVASLSPNILGFFVAPLALVQIAVHFSWRDGFFVVLVPGLVCAALVTAVIRNAPSISTPGDLASEMRQSLHRPIAEVLQYRNVWLSAALCCCFVAYISLGFTFLPLYFVNVRRFSSQQMSYLMGLLGLSAVVFAFLLPALSDRIGRKSVMIIAAASSLLCPLDVLYYQGPITVLAAGLFAGWALSGTGSFFMGTIPSETVPARIVSTAIGLIIASGVLIGGLLGPSFAGWSADRWGLQAPLLVQTGCAAAAVLIAAGLRETAPIQRATKGEI